MDLTDTVNPAVKLTDRLRAFANGTKVPRYLYVSDTELDSFESSAIIPLLWSMCINSPLEYAAYAAPGSSQDMPAWIIGIHYRKEALTPGTIFSLPILSATSVKVPRQITNTRVEGHGTG